MKRIIATLFALAPSSVWAADPCSGLDIADGTVSTGLALPVESPLSPSTAACVDAVSEELGAHEGLRGVTVTVRLPDAGRVDGTGEKALAAYVDGLVGGGLPAVRVDGRVAAGDAAEVKVAFTARAGAPPVGQVVSTSGSVTIGGIATSAGSRLQAGQTVSTGADGRAMVDLADGSRVRLQPVSSLFLGKLYLDEELNRVVELRVDRGAVDTVVAKAGPGSSFKVLTPHGTAGVRGTTFRVVADDGGATRLETLEGLVELGGEQGSVAVGALQGATVDASGQPSVPTKLLSAPTVKGPQAGDLPASGLRWKKRGRAASYRVELARDAEFVLSVSEETVGETSLVPGGLASGTWYWRVAALDEAGFSGAWSEAYAFEVSN